jgi:hypothetical protein
MALCTLELKCRRRRREEAAYRQQPDHVITVYRGVSRLEQGDLDTGGLLLLPSFSGSLLPAWKAAHSCSRE